MFVRKYLSDRCSAISIMLNCYKYNNICRQERGAKRAKRYETAKQRRQTKFMMEEEVPRRCCITANAKHLTNAPFNQSTNNASLEKHDGYITAY